MPGPLAPTEIVRRGLEGATPQPALQGGGVWCLPTAASQPVAGSRRDMPEPTAGRSLARLRRLHRPGADPPSSPRRPVKGCGRGSF